MNDKMIFNAHSQAENNTNFQEKQEFNQDEVDIEVDKDPLNDREILQGELLNAQFEQAIGTKPRWWTRALMAVFALLLLATVAQSVQWLMDTWQNHQWIYFVFALVSFSVVLLGVSAIAKEFALLHKLRQRALMQQKSLNLQGTALNLPESAVQFSADFAHNEQAQAFCLNVAKAMKLDEQHPSVVQWKQQIADSHSAQEVGFLFSQNVLNPFDQQAKKLITKNALESAAVIAISPLAVVDTLFMGWRNIRMINQIAKLYGIELGYFSRLRLMKLVLMNMALTGAAELVQEVGMDWLSQDIAAKLSARAAQGIGAGLLTARLGIKAMEFCRPISFQKQDKPRLSHIHKAVLGHLKSQVFSSSKLKQTEKL
ncbi:hypothetical protein A4G18_01560 [Pasteurellaceae bacterium Pebbles2]|nr:hypothetical protein [Pasteurellaceae bacterium Pebbles2]